MLILVILIAATTPRSKDVRAATAHLQWTKSMLGSWDWFLIWISFLYVVNWSAKGRMSYRHGLLLHGSCTECTAYCYTFLPASLLWCPFSFSHNGLKSAPFQCIISIVIFKTLYSIKEIYNHKKRDIFLRAIIEWMPVPNIKEIRT